MKKLRNNLEKKSSLVIPYRPLIAATIFLIFLGLTIYFNIFVIQTVSCHLPEGSCSEPVSAELNRTKGHSFFSGLISETIQKIKKNDPSIQEIQVTKQFPNQIQFSLTIAQPMLTIVCPEFILSIDKNGDIQQTRSEHLSSLQTIQAQSSVCDQLLAQKKFPELQLQNILTFLQTVNSVLPDHQVELSDFSTLLMKTTEERRILLFTNQLNYQLQMYLYLKDHQSLPDGWKELDLRFQRAIVR